MKVRDLLDYEGIGTRTYQVVVWEQDIVTVSTGQVVMWGRRTPLR